MRKSVFLIIALALGLLFPAQVPAQSVGDLLGKWTSIEKDDDDDLSIDETSSYTFRDDGTFEEEGTCVITMKLDDGTALSCDFVYSSKGTYSLESGVVTFKFDPKTIVIKEGRMELPGLMKALFVKPLINEVRRSLKKTTSSTIVEFDGGTLKLREQGDKDDEVTTYTKETI